MSSEVLQRVDTVEKLDFLPRSQFLRQQAGFKKKALRVGRKADLSVCGGRIELAMATRGAICPARPNSDFLMSLIFRVFQRYRPKPDFEPAQCWDPDGALRRCLNAINPDQSFVVTA